MHFLQQSKQHPERPRRGRMFMETTTAPKYPTPDGVAQHKPDIFSLNIQPRRVIAGYPG